MLATFSVTNTNDGIVLDSGDLPGSLRQAVFDSNNNPGPDEIVISSNLNGQTITLQHGSLILNDRAIIRGNSTSNPVIIRSGGSTATAIVFQGFTQDPSGAASGEQGVTNLRTCFEIA